MRKKTKPKIYEGSHYDSTKEPADQSNTGQAFQAISDQADPTSGQSMSGQNSECHPSTLQLSTQMIVDQLMTEQEMINSPSFVQSPVDLPLTDRINPSISDQSNRKRKISSAAGSAEQERQNGKEARTASSMHPSGSSSSHSEGNVPISSNNEPTPQSKAISSEEQEHEVRKHKIGLRGVMIKDKVDLVVTHKRDMSERLANENIQILKGNQQNLDKVDNDSQYLPTLKQVSFKPEPISKLDVVPLFGDLNDGTSPPTQGHSTFGIGKGFKSLDMPRQSKGQPTYGIGKGSKSLEMTHQSKGVSICDIGKDSKSFENLELSADAMEGLSADKQSDIDLPGWELPQEIIDEFLRFFNFPQGVIATFRYSFDTCFKMYPHSIPNQCWMIGYQDQVIRLVDKDGSVIEAIDIKIGPFGITMIGTNTLLVSDVNKWISQIVLPNNTMSPAFSTPFIPEDICVTSTGELLVTMADTYNENIKPQQSCVVKYTTKGREVKRSPMCDQFGDRLFVWPFKVSVNHGGDRVAVVNITSVKQRVHDLSHLVMLDGDLDLVARYTYHGQVVPRDTKYNVSSKPFRITGVQFDKCNNVLITEHYSSSVQLLDSDCRRLRILLSCENEIPAELHVDVDGDVWICYEDNCVKILRYQ
ncbi:hypothetical protein KP79_PYT19710 [Mizuhopecten yessoensis]|uniref:Uncharacterized protein n=1 Tax=Mizuhopecten yessoensis TaxID=6573 RepID=A0A210PU45_MIZYE|nr:hypothetical protein KP79_PYT19710 [Mizuhopecten yessoensis]